MTFIWFIAAVCTVLAVAAWIAEHIWPEEG
jgi:hypothetical protein